MDLWNSRYLNSTTKNNVPVYPTGTGATIEGNDVLKLNQYLAPQKTRQLNQYTPITSVDRLRFRTDEQEIARKRLDGSERILYPFVNNSLGNVLPRDLYRVNLTGNPSFFGSMTHPVAHKNTGAVDLESSDFANWKEGVDMSLYDANGSASYLSRALHNPPKDGLDINTSKYAMPVGALQFYEDKQSRYKNKRQLLYRDPITGGRQFVNLPEYPNSIAQLRAKEAADAEMNDVMIQEQQQRPNMNIGSSQLGRPDLAAVQEDEEKINNIKQRMDQRRNSQPQITTPKGYTPARQRPQRVPTPPTIYNELLNAYDEENVDEDQQARDLFASLRNEGDYGADLVDKIVQDVTQEIENQNFNSSNIISGETEFVKGIEDRKQIVLQNAESEMSSKLDAMNLSPLERQQILGRYATTLNIAMRQVQENASSYVKTVSYDNSNTKISQAQVNSMTPLRLSYLQPGFGSELRPNNLDPNNSTLNNSDDTGTHGYTLDPSPALAVVDTSVQSSMMNEMPRGTTIGRDGYTNELRAPSFPNLGNKPGVEVERGTALINNMEPPTPLQRMPGPAQESVLDSFGRTLSPQQLRELVSKEGPRNQVTKSPDILRKRVEEVNTAEESKSSRNSFTSTNQRGTARQTTRGRK
jgi:hypothetical protein